MRIRSSGAIELFGLSGAGKSTFLSKAISILNSKGSKPKIKVYYPVDSRLYQFFPETLRIAANAFCLSPKVIIKFLSKKENWDLLLKLGYRSAGIKSRGNTEGAILIDAGILMPFVSFFTVYDVSFKEVPFEPILSALELPSHVIYVRTSPELARERYENREKRKKSRRKHFFFSALNYKNLNERFSNAFQCCEYLYAKCYSMGIEIDVVDPENGMEKGSIEEIANDIFS